MDSNAKYLRVTIHDNDFTTDLRRTGDLLYNLFYEEDNYPTEEQFPILKESIKHLWYGTYVSKSLMRWGYLIPVNIDYFEPYLEFVDYLDIPDWDNRESIYIPMFDGAEILTR